ncbi:urea carboxylase [Marasmius fiardii PR-910]|nr:urea carboxylase [Marasmius fiardii PR-910]
MPCSQPYLLVANRGEIAVRIIYTAKKMGLRTISVYTPSDALSPHVSLADESVAIPVNPNESESSAYRSVEDIISICKPYPVSLVHPGYGFISEDPDAAALFIKNGITWLGPKPDVIRTMGVKHQARALAVRAGVPVVPGSDGVVENEEDAVAVVAGKIGYPAILKATSGGGGMGMVVCESEAELRGKFQETVDRAKALFGDGRIFIERYFIAARHIEIQIFGYGNGKVVHMGERECSIQRRHQKVIEESPSPFFYRHEGLRERMCNAAVQLGEAINYSSAGTVEFIVDDATGDFFFLEMNTRIQVEHPVTEMVHPGLDLVQWMIELGIAERENRHWTRDLQNFNLSVAAGHAIEVRIYSENPFECFKPCPGVLQFVDLREKAGYEWLRVESWVSTGTSISPFFDPLICKLVVHGSTREEALSRLDHILNEVKVHGPPNNLEYLKCVTRSEVFRSGRGTTQFLNTVTFTPNSFTVVSPGLDCSIQDFPGRTMGLGIPRSGAIDSMALRIANVLVGNPHTTEGLEVIVVPNVDLELLFHVETVIAVTGKSVDVSVDGVRQVMWGRILIPAGGTLLLQHVAGRGGGLRCYVAFRGGFPNIPKYLDSKSTSMGLGGYQGRKLLTGDEIALDPDSRCSPSDSSSGQTLPLHAIPVYPSQWVIHVLSGPHEDEEFITSDGIQRLYSTHWKVSASSNRMGIRLEADSTILWARKDGGEGGSHPSNILDVGYAPGTVNINGDTPVILTVEGPDMGGYVCAFTICEADWWKTGQLNPGDTIQFTRVTWEQARVLQERNESFIGGIENSIGSTALLAATFNLSHAEFEDAPYDPKLRVITPTATKPQAVFRLAGDSCILLELGDMTLDFVIRARIHEFEGEVKRRNIEGIRRFCPCVRSTMIHFDPSVILSLHTLVEALVEAYYATPDDYSKMVFPGRRVTLPMVPDDKWNREAVEKYMKTTRDKAVYLPSNVEYLAKNNGLRDGKEALGKLTSSDFLVIGVGFYLGLPFMVPIDPRCRVVGQKMNPSRTYTPRGAIGVAGVVAAIYPIESPGGYQLYGRTLPGWNTWGQGRDFRPDKPWFFESFDQVRFELISEEEYPTLERGFDTGRYQFKIERVTFSVQDYLDFVQPLQKEIEAFRNAQRQAVAETSLAEQTLLKEWENSKEKAKATTDTRESRAVNTDSTTAITAPLQASIWKIKTRPGDEIQSPNEILIVLEAMKTEIPVKAGSRNVGKKVVGFGDVNGQVVAEGTAVQMGDVLVLLN